MYKRVFLFLKHHWKIPVVLTLLLVCAIVYRSKVSSLLGALHQTRDDYKKALDETQEANKKAIDSVGRGAIAALEQQESRQEKLNKELNGLEKERDSLEEELEEDLDKLAREIKEKF